MQDGSYFSLRTNGEESDLSIFQCWLFLLAEKQYSTSCKCLLFTSSFPSQHTLFILFCISACECALLFFQPACCLFDKQPDAVTMMTQKDAERSSSWQDEISQMRSGSAAFPCFWSRPLSFYMAMYSITSSFSWDSFPFCSSRIADNNSSSHSSRTPASL